MTKRISRKDFLQGSLSAAVAAGLAPWGRAAEHSTHSAAERAQGAFIPGLNPVMRLYPAKALERTGEVRFGPAEIDVMLPFFGSGGVTWVINAPVAGRYRVAACYAATVAGSKLEVEAADSVIRHDTQVTEGFFLPEPAGPAANPSGPDGDTFWSEREFYCFERVSLSGELRLTGGVNLVKLRLTGPRGKEIFRLRSLELLPVAQEAAIETQRQTALRHRANTDWFARAGYGLWFHFLDLTTPRHGPRKPYVDAVNDLDVEALARLVEECGAAYVILTTNHGNPTCPAPIRSWEELHPGWTTRRDLIGELADALGKRGIGLLLYMNCPGLGGLTQLPGTGIDRPAVSEERYAAILMKVFAEFGHRYGRRLAGYWLDSWFQTDESYPNLPFDKLSEAIKAGYPDRLVAYNNWAFPIETPWQDYWSGELTDLPLKRFKSRYIHRGAGQGLQAHSAIRLDAPWFHITPDTEMEPPRYTAAQLAEYIKSCMEDQAAVTLGVGMFQDGTIGEPSRQVLAQLRRLLRGK